MYILGNNVASQEEFDAHVAAEKEEHLKLKEHIAVVDKALSSEIESLATKHRQLDRQINILKIALVVVLLIGVVTVLAF